MTAPPIRDAAGVHRWTCDGCGKYGPWTDGHRVYGRLRDQDESRWYRLVVTCGVACEAKVKADGLVHPDTGKVRVRRREAQADRLWKPA